MKCFNKKRVMQSLAVIGAVSLGCTANVNVFGQEGGHIIKKVHPEQKQKQKQIQIQKQKQLKVVARADFNAGQQLTKTISLQCSIDENGEEIIRLIVDGKEIDVDSLDEANAIIKKLGTTALNNKFITINTPNEDCESICEDDIVQTCGIRDLDLCKEIRIMINGDAAQSGTQEYKIFKMTGGNGSQIINMAPLSWTTKSATFGTDECGDDCTDNCRKSEAGECSEILESDCLELKGLGTITGTDDGQIMVFSQGNTFTTASPQTFKYDVVTNTTSSTSCGDDDDDENNLAFRIAGNEPPKVMLGVMMDSVPEALQDFLQLDDEQGAMITQVIEGTPAHKAGLKAKDIIIGIAQSNKDKIKYVNYETLGKYLADYDPGDKIKLKINRAGSYKVIKVTLNKWDPMTMNIPKPNSKNTEGWHEIYQNKHTPQLKAQTDKKILRYKSEDGRKWVEKLENLKELKGMQSLKHLRSEGLHKLNEIKGIESLKELRKTEGIIELNDLYEQLNSVIDLRPFMESDSDSDIRIISPDDEADIEYEKFIEDFDADDPANSLQGMDEEVNTNLSQMMKNLEEQMQQLKIMINKLREQQQDLRKQINEIREVDV